MEKLITNHGKKKRKITKKNYQQNFIHQ